MAKVPKIKISTRITRRYLNVAAVSIFLLTLFTSFFPPYLSTPYKQLAGYGFTLMILLWNYRRILISAAGLLKNSDDDREIVPENAKFTHIKKINNHHEGPCPCLTLGFNEKTGEEVIWPDERQVTHMILTGTTGSGKSSFLFNLLWQQMLRGGGAVFIDGGRNPQTIKNLVYMCEKARTLSRLRIVDPRAPKTGHAYNPLLSGDAGALTNKIMKVLNPIPAGSEAEYYKSKIYHATSMLIRMLTSIGKPFNIRDILCLYCVPEVSFKILEQQLVRYGLSDSLVSLKTLIMETRNAKVFRDDLSGIIANLGSVSDGEIGQSLCSPTAQVNLYDAVKKSQILYFMLPRMSDAEKATRLGRLLLGDIQTTIGLFYEEKEFKPIVPFLIILDEFGSYASPEFAVVFEQARKANFSVVAAVQSFGNLCNPYAGLSREFMQQVLGNTNTRVFLTVSDAETARMAAELVGRDITYFKNISTSTQTSEGAEAISARRFLNPMKTDREAVTEGYSEKYDYRLRPEVFMHELGKVKGRAIVDFKDGNPFFVRVAWFKSTVPSDYTYEDKIPRFSSEKVEALSLWERVQAQLKHMEVSFEGEKQEKEKEPSCKLIVDVRKNRKNTKFVALLIDGKEVIKEISGRVQGRDELIAGYKAVERGLKAAIEGKYREVSVYSPIKTMIGQLGTGNVAQEAPEKPLFDRVKEIEKELRVSYHQAGEGEAALVEKYLNGRTVNTEKKMERPMSKAKRKKQVQEGNSSSGREGDLKEQTRQADRKSEELSGESAEKASRSKDRQLWYKSLLEE